MVRPTIAQKPKKIKKGKDAESDSEDEEEDMIEPLSSQEAYLFPIVRPRIVVDTLV